MSAGSALAESGLLETFQQDVEDLRNLLQCSICCKPLYEPFTLTCGHTFCYTCLTQWFLSHRRSKTCPDCRSPVVAEPSPSYLLRNIIHLFVSRPELLDDGESTAEHLANQRAETEKVEEDKRNTDPSDGGLFKGCFKRRAPCDPIQDLEDGVARCPECAWELEEGECLQCGFTLHWISSDDEFDSERPRSRSVTMSDSEAAVHGYVDDWEGDHTLDDFYSSHFHHHRHDDELSDDNSEDDGSDSELDSFVVDDDEIEQATVTGGSERNSPYFTPDDASGRALDMDHHGDDIGLSFRASYAMASSGPNSDIDSGEDNDDEQDDEDDEDDSDEGPIQVASRSSRPARPSGSRAHARGAQPYSIDSSRNRRSQRGRSGSSSREAISLDSDDDDDDSSDAPRQRLRRRRLVY